MHDLNVLDTSPEPALDELVEFARQRFMVPTAFISLVAESRQWFKAKAGLDVGEASREHAFCDHTIRQRQVLVVEDARVDPRFMNNPFVIGPPRIRFYAGAPLIYKQQAIGSFCIINKDPRSFSDTDRKDLVVLAKATVAELEMSRARRFLLP
ncbi:GAF domain-containing protein [Skermanella stibiiresistens]|uniref:GAF domain-containing protein n=1 Tax=Skermanella stibiiresistens TaxID=913326 RepID=UPI0018DBE1EB|nr:GAF domain-containing protein [Skermanella stibiiresistens]